MAYSEGGFEADIQSAESTSSSGSETPGDTSSTGDQEMVKVGESNSGTGGAATPGRPRPPPFPPPAAPAAGARSGAPPALGRTGRSNGSSRVCSGSRTMLIRAGCRPGSSRDWREKATTSTRTTVTSRLPT